MPWPAASLQAKSGAWSISARFLPTIIALHCSYDVCSRHLARYRQKCFHFSSTAVSVKPRRFCKKVRLHAASASHVWVKNDPFPRRKDNCGVELHAAIIGDGVAVCDDSPSACAAGLAVVAHSSGWTLNMTKPEDHRTNKAETI